jgi:hypothetical protein
MSETTYAWVKQIEQFVKDEMAKCAAYENRELGFAHAYGVLAGVEVQLRILKDAMDPDNPFTDNYQPKETKEDLEVAA